MIRTGLIASAVIFAVTLAITVFGWMGIGEDARIVTQWALDGSPNRYGSKSVLLAVPAIMAVIIPLLALFPLIDPRRENLQKSAGFYLIGWVGGLIVAAFAQGAIVWGAMTGAPPSVEAIITLTSVMVIALGNAMAKSRSNWFAGIRTPWTLASEHAWSVANRLAGWGSVLSGSLAIIATYAVDVRAGALILVAGLLASIVVATVMSYFAWRGDPDRAPDRAV